MFGINHMGLKEKKQMNEKSVTWFQDIIILTRLCLNVSFQRVKQVKRTNAFERKQLAWAKGGPKCNLYKQLE
ncbi:hypothetical protein Hanom_Chr12g01164971 [Helianthus anomalus]